MAELPCVLLHRVPILIRMYPLKQKPQAHDMVNACAMLHLRFSGPLMFLHMIGRRDAGSQLQPLSPLSA